MFNKGSFYLDLNRFGILIILLYLFFINVYIVNSSPEVILLQLFFVVFVLTRSKLKKFIKDWIPFISLFVFFEFLRGQVDDLSPFYSSSLLFWAYNIEKGIFTMLPTQYLQESSLYNFVILSISFFFYFSFYYYSFAGAFLIWISKPELFRRYTRYFLIMSYVGLLIFFLTPTAPPWLVSNINALSVKRFIYEQTFIKRFLDLPLYRYLVFGNDVAAFPSLHVAWVSFTSGFGVELKGWKYLPCLLITPVMVGFSSLILGEHYLIDVLAGYILGFFFAHFAFKSNARLLEKGRVN